MMSNVIPLTADIVFKYVFGSEDSETPLKAFLSAVQQDADFPPLSDVKITNPFNLQQFTGDKASIIDVRARDEAGRQYNVEVQVRRHPAFAERTLYYWAKSYSDQLDEGHEYRKLRRVVGVSVIGFDQFPEAPSPHTCFMLRENRNRDLVLTEDCILHYLEVNKVRSEPSSQLERWLYYLKNGALEDQTMKVLLDEDRNIREAHERYKRFVQTDETREAYEARMKFLHDQASYLADAREQEAQAIAKRMKGDGEPTVRIARYTGLSVEEIEKL
jgi:predicted transposase/invertase (TIGR01784 family)